MASGGLAGAGSLTIVYPLDYARTRLASDVGPGKQTFSGVWDCWMKTVRGPSRFFGLYHGFGVSLIGILPGRGVAVGLYDSLLVFNPYRKDRTPIGVLSKFSLAQICALLAGYTAYPFDTIRRRLQMQSELPKEQWIYKGTVDCLLSITKKEGVRGLFSGAGANALRTVGSALVLVLYGEFKEALGT